MTPEPPWLTDLRQAVDGLTYPSESDEPFDVFTWPAGETDALAELRQHGVDTTIQSETSIAEFLEGVRSDDDFVRFQHLAALLQKNLVSLRVLRLGDIEVDVYLIGKSVDGRWAGAHTRSVET